MHSSLHSRFLTACSLIAFLCVPAFSTVADEDTPRPPPRSVVVTTGMLADLARSILPEDAKIRALMGPGIDPHLFKPTRDDVARIMAADLVVVNGLKLEGKMGDVITRAARDRWAIAVGDLLYEKDVIRPEGAEDHPDPHVWMDPSLWASAAERFAYVVGVEAPPDAAETKARAEAYANELRALDEWARGVMETIPASQRVLITSHDAFAYLGRAYDMRVEGVQGLSTDSEPGLQRIGELVDLIVENKVPAVFVESSVPRKSIEALIEGAQARGHKVVIGGELFSDALGPAGTWEGTVPGMIDHNVTTIVRALGGKAAPGGWKGRLAGALKFAPQSPKAPDDRPIPPRAPAAPPKVGG